MHKTFLGAHTHRNHRLQIQHVKCVPHRPQSLLRFLSAMPMARTRADVRRKPMSRHATAACTPVSVRVCGRQLSSGCPMPACLLEPLFPCLRAHASVLFPFFEGRQEHFRGKLRRVFLKDKKKAAVRQTPAANTNASRHAGEIGGHGVDMPWSPYRKIKPTRPQHGNERPRTWVSRWTCMQCTAHSHTCSGDDLECLCTQTMSRSYQTTNRARPHSHTLLLSTN
jgi:hypothetical protein